MTFDFFFVVVSVVVVVWVVVVWWFFVLGEGRVIFLAAALTADQT